MLKKERPYQFRERLCQVHPANIRDFSLVPAEDEYVLNDGIVISVPADCGNIIINAAKDFCDYLYTSMDLSGRFTKQQGGNITVSVDPAYGSYKAFQAEISADGISITAHDERGAAQALFFLEEEMSTRHAPFIPFGCTERAPLFSPRMTHSGYMLDEYPESHLAQIAHAGMDAIMVMTCDVNESLWGYTDFNDLIRRASDWGLDVYAYSYYRSKKHPDDPEADAHYESTYGALFKQCPGFKGVILVGESIGFPSKDPKASPLPYDANNIDGIPSSKPSADFWPCTDYREWLIKLQSIIYKYNPNADIVFWSYNWGYANTEDRQALIRRLPKGISMLVTFENFGQYQAQEGFYEQVYDYSLAFEGPGHYFISEASVAKECGVRLYAMTNTGGDTWDMGGLPYEPMPGQWLKRAKNVLDCKEKYGLCGIMESHQYGFTPSIVSDMIKYVYHTGHTDVDAELKRILARHFGLGQEAVIAEALEKWSEAIRLLPPTGENQCGVFRIGPSYPFSIKGTYIPPTDKCAKGNFKTTRYPLFNRGDYGVPGTTGVRLPVEQQMMQKMLVLLQEGCKILETVPSPNDELLYLINMGHFMERIVTSGIHIQQWYLTVTKMQIEPDNEMVKQYLAEADRILDAERENVLATIPIIEADSRLGWDPRMEYVCDRRRLDWKLKLLDYVQHTELNQYRACTNFRPKQ